MRIRLAEFVRKHEYIPICFFSDMRGEKTPLGERDKREYSKREPDRVGLSF